jgi:hypothetical protein
MKWKLSILSFILALTTGVCVGISPSIPERLWPSFSKAEAAAMVGRRVRHRWNEKFMVHKCFEEEPCLLIGDGEYGTVIGIEPVPDGGYFLIVQWDKPKLPHLSYFGRYSYKFLKEQ